MLHVNIHSTAANDDNPHHQCSETSLHTPVAQLASPTPAPCRFCYEAVAALATAAAACTYPVCAVAHSSVTAHT